MKKILILLITVFIVVSGFAQNLALHVKMRDLEIPHEYRVRQGGHEWEYWRTGLYDGLKFISEKFHR